VPIENEDGTTVDEIKHYLDEAYWRIFSFQVHKKSPAIERLYFHLPSENSVIFPKFDSFTSHKKFYHQTWLNYVKKLT